MNDGVGFDGWEMGVGRSLERARKVSREKVEKEVKEPQKPVARPMYSGIVFLTLEWADGSKEWCEADEEEEGVFSSVLEEEEAGPHSSRKRRLSSLRKPMKKEPPTFAQRTGVTTGAPG